MAIQKKTFQCLRCEHRFPVTYDPRKVAERACPKCGSNSVRAEPAKRPATSPEKARAG